MISITDLPTATQLNADMAMSIFSDLVSERERSEEYWRQIVNDQAAEIEELKEQLARARASESETDNIHHIQVTKFANFFDWMQKLMENKTIPAACKLVLMQIYLSFYFMRSSIVAEEMRIGIEETAKKTGMSASTVRKACDKFQEHDVLARRYEPTISDKGDKITLVHFTLNEIALAPDSIEMENNHGGKREKRCHNPSCQSNNVDRYTVQYCRDCQQNEWYSQPGTRNDANVQDAQQAQNMPLYKSDNEKHLDFEPETDISIRIDSAIVAEDAPYEKAQRAENRTPYGKGKKQDAFEPETNLSSRIESAIEKINEQIPEYAPGTMLSEVLDRLDEEIEIAAQPKKQDAFSSPAAQLEAEHNTYVAQQVAIKAPKAAVCKAIWSMNKDGKPANAKLHEKVASIQECGSTRWHWQESEKSYICSVCYTSLPTPF